MRVAADGRRRNSTLGTVICREFLKALPKRISFWVVGLWLALLVWNLIFVLGDQYTAWIQHAARTLNLITTEHFQEFFELAPPRHPVKGIALLLSPRLAPSHGLAMFSTMGVIIVVVLAAKLFGDEYGFSTIRRLWTEGPPRAVHLAGKVGAICLTILAGMALTCLVAVLLTAVVRWFYPIPWAPAADFPSLGALAGRFALQLAVSVAIMLFPALLAATIAAATRSTFAGAVAALVHAMFPPEGFLPPRLQPFFPTWHVDVLQALAFPEFAVGSLQPATVQMGYRVCTVSTTRELPAMVGFELPPVGPEPSLAVSLVVLGAYLVLLLGALHVLWHRQEAP